MTDRTETTPRARWQPPRVQRIYAGEAQLGFTPAQIEGMAKGS